MSRFEIRTLAAVLLLALCSVPNLGHACPFCSATSQTLSQEIAAADVVVLAKLLSVPQAVEPTEEDIGNFGLVDPDTGKAKFRVVEVLKGNEHILTAEQIEVVFYGEPDPQAAYMITGLGSPSLAWTTPMPLGPASRAYIEKLSDVPKAGADRLAFFQDYLEHTDRMLAQDAYDEFARAPYEVVLALKERMRHDQLVEWIEDLDVPPSRRRLYLTMLGVCGGKDDLAMLETMIRSDDRQVKRAFDATVACYLMLKGAEGLPLIEELFLISDKADYQDTYATVVALRFHGEAVDVIPRTRLLVAMRHLLNHPDLADQIIPDLARWQDWTVMDRMIDLFRRTGEQAKWTRVPIINYLQECGRQDNEVGRKALAAIDELAKIDPDSVERAKSYFVFGSRAGGGLVASGQQQTEETAPQTDEAAGETAAPDTSLSETVVPAAPAEAPTDAAPSGSTAALGQSAGSLPAETAEEATLPGPLLIVVTALVAGLVLLAVLWLILRGAGEQKPARS